MYYLDNEIIDVFNDSNNLCPNIDNISSDNIILEHSTLNINIENRAILIYCKGCKKSCDPNLFNDPIRNKTFKQCGDCRQRDYARRHPVPMHAHPDTTLQPSTTCECKRKLFI